MNRVAAVGVCGARSLSIASPVLHLKKAQLALQEDAQADIQAIITKAKWLAQQDLNKETDDDIKAALNAEIRAYASLTPDNVLDQANRIQKVRMELASVRKYPDVSWERLEEVRDELLRRYFAAGNAERDQQNLDKLKTNKAAAETLFNQAPKLLSSSGEVDTETTDAVLKCTPATRKVLTNDKVRITEQADFQNTLQRAAAPQVDWASQYANATDRTAVAEKRVRCELMDDYLGRLRADINAAPVVIGGVGCSKTKFTFDSTTAIMEDSQDLDDEVDWLRVTGRDLVDYENGIAFEGRLHSEGYVTTDEGFDWFPERRAEYYFRSETQHIGGYWGRRPGFSMWKDAGRNFHPTQDADYESFTLEDWDDKRQESLLSARAALEERLQDPAARAELGVLGTMPVKMDEQYLSAMKVKAAALEAENGIQASGESDPKGRLAALVDRVRLDYIDAKAYC